MPTTLTLDHSLQLGHRCVLLGVREDGGLLPPDHEEHVLEKRVG